MVDVFGKKKKTFSFLPTYLIRRRFRKPFGGPSAAPPRPKPRPGTRAVRCLRVTDRRGRLAVRREPICLHAHANNRTECPDWSPLLWLSANATDASRPRQWAVCLVRFFFFSPTTKRVSESRKNVCLIPASFLASRRLCRVYGKQQTRVLCVISVRSLPHRPLPQRPPTPVPHSNGDSAEPRLPTIRTTDIITHTRTHTQTYR